MSKIAFITGATSGIGKSCAEIFGRNHYNLIINGRRKDRLEKLKIELENKFGIKTIALCFDVRDNKTVKEQIDKLNPEWLNIDVLINNAGLAAGYSSIQEGSLEDWEQMIDTNIKGLLYVSKTIIPLMIAKQSGHIINIGSIAGKEVYPNGNVYCASKFAVDALSKSMRIDLLSHNIKVTQVTPGAVKTEFSLVRFKNDESKAEKVYEGFKPLNPEDIAEIIFYITSLPTHVNINDIVIMPTQQASSMHFNRL